MKTTQNTAILLFSNSYVKEHNEKKVLSSFSENKLLFKALFDKTVKEIRKTNLPYFIDTNYTQIGQSFGEKLSNSIQKIFQKGFSKVIILGSDSPKISAQIINKASSKLAENKCIIGPSNDGGTYLIGLSKSTFNKSEFCTLKFKNEYQYKNLLNILNGELLTAHLSDIDTIEDWCKYVKLPVTHDFLLHFIFLFKKTLSLNHCQKIIYKTFSNSSLFLRGPPQLA